MNSIDSLLTEHSCFLFKVTMEDKTEYSFSKQEGPVTIEAILCVPYTPGEPVSFVYKEDHEEWFRFCRKITAAATWFQTLYQQLEEAVYKRDRLRLLVKSGA